MICFARLRSTAAAALALVLLTQPALAGTILSPIAVINNTIGNYKGIAGFPEDTDETPMFNQSGLSLGFTSGVTDFAAYIGSNPTHIGGTPEIGNGWISPAYCPCTGTLDFDLGANYSIKQMALWNMAANSGANVAEINLYSSKTADFAAPTAIGSFTNRKCPTIIARARRIRQRYSTWTIRSAATSDCRSIRITRLIWFRKSAKSLSTSAPYRYRLCYGCLPPPVSASLARVGSGKLRH